MIFELHPQTLKNKGDPACLINVGRARLHSARRMIVHQHNARCVDSNTTSNDSAQTPINSTQFTVVKRFIEDEVIIAFEQSEMNPFAAKAFKQSDNPMSHIALTQIERYAANPLSQTLENRWLDSHEAPYNGFVLNDAGQRIVR